MKNFLRLAKSFQCANHKISIISRNLQKRR